MCSFLDDILIFGQIVEEHNKRLDDALIQLRETGPKLTSDKCKLMQTGVQSMTLNK